jgi:predicted metalloendopeptidase
MRAVPAADLRSGIQSQYFDHAVRPQDNFYQYVNGNWLAQTEIPVDRPAYGAAAQLYDEVQRQLEAVLTALRTSNTQDADAARITALYRSFMDEAHIERQGTAPLQEEFSRIARLRSRSELPDLIAHLQRLGCLTPLSLSVHLDPTDASRYAANLQQDGLGLPDRRYYLEQDATTLRLIRRQYQQHIESQLRRLGDPRAHQEAMAILALETSLAQAQWTRSESSDPVRTYHRYALSDLRTLGRHFDWHRYVSALGVSDRSDYLIASEPDFLTAFDQASAQIPLSTWKAYFRWHLLSDFSPYLPRAFSEAWFDFYGRTLQGIPRNDPRERRALLLIDQHLGQALGRAYVAQHFSAGEKARAEQLVRNIITAFQQRIGALSWLGPTSRAEALRKLDRLTIKVGYPDRWRDDSTLGIRSDDLIGNVMRANAFEFDRNIHRLDRPIDHSEWDDSPQTVNAYYNPRMNEIVFPAAILRPPFFDAEVDDAANYGGIGMVVGHELSHAFDEQGSAYDSEGRLRDWWTPDEHARFNARVQPLVDEYDAFVPLRGRQIDGRRTLRENIADNAGIAVAYTAYQISLDGRPPPVIDGLTGDQRFFMGFAQAWREKIRDSVAIEMIESDSHALSYVRVLGTLLNQSAFYQTFDVEPGDRMYLPPESRVSFW